MKATDILHIHIKKFHGAQIKNPGWNHPFDFRVEEIQAFSQDDLRKKYIRYLKSLLKNTQ